MNLTYPELTFKPENHTYWLNGIYIPGVSELMKPLSESFYGFIDQAILDAAAERGTSIHETIENYIKFGIEDCEPAYQPYFNAFLNWKRRYRVEVVASEIVVYNRVLRYAGTADILCRINGSLYLVDLKTTSAINHMLTSVQLAAYNAALASHDVKADQKAVLQIKKDGTWRFDLLEKADEREAIETLGALLTVYGHIQKYKKG